MQPDCPAAKIASRRGCPAQKMDVYQRSIVGLTVEPSGFIARDSTKLHGVRFLGRFVMWITCFRGLSFDDGDYAMGTASLRDDSRIGVVLDLCFEVGHANFC